MIKRTSITGIVGLMLVMNAALPGAEGDKKVYRLEPNDEIRVTVRHIDEFTKESIRVDGEGFVNLPLIGSIKAEQMTTSELESSLREQLKMYLVDPDVTVVLVKRRSHPVSVIGSVQTPGVHQLDEPKRLIEVISLAGGVREDAGSLVNITRRLDQGPLPLPNARLDPSGEFYIGEVALDMLVRAKTPALNIMVQPNDVISVPRGELVYVMGEVKRSGGFVLRSSEKIRILQALAMAEGLSPTAGPKHSKILRLDPARGERTEIAVNLKKIMDGTGEDFMMEPNDVLVVPNNLPRSATLRGIEAAVQMGTGIVIWRR